MKKLTYLLLFLSILSFSCVSADKKSKIKSKKQQVEDFNFAKSLNGLNWMWSSASSSPNAGTSYFRKVFILPPDIKKSEIYLTSDNENSVFINGAFAGSNGEWEVSSSYDLTSPLIPPGIRGVRDLQRGNNVIAIQVVNEGTNANPAGLIGKIILQDKNGKIKEIPIDKTFKCSDTYAANWNNINFDDSKWHNAFVIVPYGSSPWGMFDFANNPKSRFPEFIVPGHQKEMDLLSKMFMIHYPVPMLGTFNMQWTTESTLWPAIKPIVNNPKIVSYKEAISSRDLSDEGYLSCHQHRGLGLPDGWPFPTWWQSKGMGWHFAKDTIYNSPLTKSISDWKIKNAETISIDEKYGWQIKLTTPNATIQSPLISVKEIVAPYIRLEWTWRDDVPNVLNSDDKSGRRGRRPSRKPYLEWTSVKYPEFSKARRVYCKKEKDSGLLFTIFPLLENKFWNTNDTLTKIKICFGNEKPATVNIHALFTVVDTRHDVNNAIYLQACDSFINWTADKDFLKNNIGKMRKALAYAINEFQVESNKCVSVPWQGHDGRSGLIFDKDGKKIIRYGVGIGSGYWDIMPFGGKDALATIYLYDAINKMAVLEQKIEMHPEWKISKDKYQYKSAKLKSLAKEIKINSTQFWNEKAGRFGAAMDCEGVLHDYGYTFVNFEAIHYGYANKDQSTQIVDWISGKRSIENDTSKGKDIYKFKFAPRASTLRNVEYYNYSWTAPESIPFGGQVQDGGAVLGFSYHDLMSRLKTRGADDTWHRLKTIINWFGDVQKEGGYRKYYKNHPEEGTLQGGGPAGGLGVDKEFFESVLVPQVMIYGFMGLQPMIDGFSINPELPTDWPSLTITKINLHGNVLEIKADKSKIEINIIDITNPVNARKDKIYLPEGVKKVIYYNADGKKIFVIDKKAKSVPLIKNNSRKVVVILNKKIIHAKRLHL
ncbi:beta galactosidase jelly roll domain-containing protein [bacterium]|nr:beta galactosidase jelly roll domain-containing protein [bacterium]